MRTTEFEHKIASLVHKTDITAQVWLFGSRARGDFNADSDWDVLILLDKDRVTERDHERISFPLFDLAIDTGTIISPKIYTLKEWEKRHFTPFYKNVTKERRMLA